jgi:hypothetical protein
MATEKLEDLTIEQLRKRYKGFTIFIIIMGASWIAIITSMFIIKSHSAMIFIGVAIATLSPLWFFGRKNIREEIKKRENSA